MKHGKCFTGEYKSWQSAKDRCHNPLSKDYPKYGARGIFMCQEWRDDFCCFYKDMGNRPQGKSLERIDNNLGYFKENCKWADIVEQSNNRRNTKYATYNGVTKTAAQWAKECNITIQAMHKRIKKYNSPMGSI